MDSNQTNGAPTRYLRFKAYSDNAVLHINLNAS